MTGSLQTQKGHTERFDLDQTNIAAPARER